ncbi:MAG: hypothetical protein MUP69_11460 [Candidatus Atribacteria bacterium]|nr:hypothetical protein [Candidatus Atribacteria bacterium]
MQDKSKKNLSKILFIVILLSFIILLVGCSWLSLGLLNIFDPQAQIRIKNFDYTNDYKNIVTFEAFTINQVECIISDFEFDYYRGASRVTSLDRTVGVNYYVAPSSAPGVEGTSTPITDLYLYSSGVLDYVKAYSAFNEITCDLYIAGTDGAGHDLKVKVASGLAALGVDNKAPIANISYEPTSGDCPLTVFFDGSTSDDGGDGLGIAKFEWYLPEISSSIISTDISFSHTFSCALVTDSEEVITVSLTVTDYYGNEGSAAESVTIKNPNATSGGGCTG